MSRYPEHISGQIMCPAAAGLWLDGWKCEMYPRVIMLPSIEINLVDHHLHVRRSSYVSFTGACFRHLYCTAGFAARSWTGRAARTLSQAEYVVRVARFSRCSTDRAAHPSPLSPRSFPLILAFARRRESRSYPKKKRRQRQTGNGSCWRPRRRVSTKTKGCSAAHVLPCGPAPEKPVVHRWTGKRPETSSCGGWGCGERFRELKHEILKRQTSEQRVS